jgi:hypothetical protein
MADKNNSNKGSGKGFVQVGAKKLAPKTLNTSKSNMTKRSK